jgi:hypothetical protein
MRGEYGGDLTTGGHAGHLAGGRLGEPGGPLRINWNADATLGAGGLAYEDHWARDRWVKGAYSYMRVGQAASYGPIAAAPEGRVHFAGEHTSINTRIFWTGRSKLESAPRARSSGRSAARDGSNRC